MQTNGDWMHNTDLVALDSFVLSPTTRNAYLLTKKRHASLVTHLSN